MTRRHRHGADYIVTTEEYHRRRDIAETQRALLTEEELNRILYDRMNKLTEFVTANNMISIEELQAVESQLAPIEQKVMKDIEHELFDPLREFIHGFLFGLAYGHEGSTQVYITQLIQRLSSEAYIKLRYKNAYKWKGFIVQFYFDDLFNVIVNSKPELLDAIHDAVRYANRYVRLIQGFEGENKSIAHEYLSFLRKRRCHLSMMSIKVSPVTIRILQNKEGRFYVAVHISSQTLTYSPYSFKTMKNIPWFSVINRRKGLEWFSMKIDGGYTIVDLNSIITTAKDIYDNPYLYRTVAEAIFRPYTLIKDRMRSIGKPEARFDAEACSLYFIPERRTKSKKLDRLDSKKRFLEKRKIYRKVQIV